MDIQQRSGNLIDRSKFDLSPTLLTQTTQHSKFAMSVCLRHTPCIGSTFTSYALRSVTRFPTLAVRPYSTPADSQDDPIDDSFIPTPIDRSYETPDVTRARLVYQSRKRGILETDLVLSTFADKFLPTMSPEELKEYDKVKSRPKTSLIAPAA